MPTITFSLKDLENLVGKKLGIGKVQEYAHYGKGDMENYDKDSGEVKIDFGDTNLPYLWSVEGFARLIKGILGINKGVPQIKLNASKYDIIADKSVSGIRPFIGGFAAKGRKIDDYMLKQLIQLQEKLADNFGRKRQKASIGLYSYKRIKFPIYYKAVEPESVSFAPLESDRKLSLLQIIAQHPKGKEYGPILREFGKYPVLTDENGEVLSFPPIINSNNFTGRVEVGDDSLFLEVTGTDERSVLLIINIFAYALYDRGFNIFSANVKYPGRSAATPKLFNESISLNHKYISKLFGLELKQGEVKELLEKAQYSVKGSKIEIPSYRNDIMHPCDIVEDIGIMYGYDRIKEEPLRTFTIGKTSDFVSFTLKVREILVGLGYQEAMSPMLSNKNLLYGKMGISDTGTVEIEEFMSETYSVVRSWILPNLMELLSKNKHVLFPQKIFEEGLVNVRKGSDILEY
ncbi:phenylalanine--tRNA ligase subunit beta, partial [Candidatus Woesearchaeota archaeon]|nr:phenylalanine--tRNA ligase subunit beta [Candidatus Woesearchaeota archaeon]